MKLSFRMMKQRRIVKKRTTNSRRNVFRVFTKSKRPSKRLQIESMTKFRQRKMIHKR